jgi:hypothetical protein
MPCAIAYELQEKRKEDEKSMGMLCGEWRGNHKNKKITQ